MGVFVIWKNKSLCAAPRLSIWLQQQPRDSNKRFNNDVWFFFSSYQIPLFFYEFYVVCSFKRKSSQVNSRVSFVKRDGHAAVAKCFLLAALFPCDHVVSSWKTEAYQVLCIKTISLTGFFLNPLPLELQAQASRRQLWSRGVDLSPPF